MVYNGKELIEYKPTEGIVFNPPKKMLVWDHNDGKCVETDVVAVLPNRTNPVIATKLTWMYCAEIPEPKLATHRELARWLAEGKGQYRMILTTDSNLTYANEDENNSVNELLTVRKWSDTEWHKPTREYLGLEDK